MTSHLAREHCEFMKFTLYYDGPLPSAANSSRIEDKHRIRSLLHWQLLQLFRDHPALPKLLPQYADATDWANWPEWRWPQFLAPWDENSAIVKIGDLHYVPLVRESLDLICELDILFLRPGRPGLMERGERYDIDNRLLTLFDALTIPTGDAACAFAVADQALSRTSPLFCLLGDDSRITAVNVRTDSLLTADENKTAQPHGVRLVVTVTLKVVRLTHGNVGLGD